MDFSQFLQKKLQATPETLPFSGLAGGLPKGKLMEISGTLGGGKTEILLRFLRENPSVQVAWIEVGPNGGGDICHDIYPGAFPERGVDLSRVLFVEPSSLNEALWCAQQILKSQIFGAVVLSRRQLDKETVPAQIIPHTTQHHHTMQARPRDSRSSELRGPRGRVVSKKDSPINLKSELGEIELRRLQIAAEKSGSMVFLLQEKPMLSGNWPIYLQLNVEQKKIQVIKHRGSATNQTLSPAASSSHGQAANTTEGEWAQSIG